MRLTIAQAAQKQQAMKAAPTRAADIRRRQRAVQIGPHMSRGPAGQSPTRLSHHASQEVLKPGLCFSANQCPGTWRRRRVRACIDPHTGSASRQRIHKPSADAEAPMAEPRRATCPAQAGVRVCARCFQAAGVHGTCNQGGGVYAVQASPLSSSSSRSSSNYRLLPVQAAVASRGGAKQNASCAHFLRQTNI